MSLKLVQKGLNGLGYDVGEADGIFGPRLDGGLVRLRENKGQPVSVARPAPQPVVPGHPRLYQGTARYLIDEIVLHCSDTRPDWMKANSFTERYRELRRWHMQDRGWKDIGYHWVIDRDGEIQPGRAETVIGAGVAGHNSGVIHACLLGGHGSAETDQFEEHFTPPQGRAVLALIGNIAARTTIACVSGHNEWAAKACPGFNVPNWLKERVA